jgi:O-acetyl-ADP-ribose deacetylase (regulator of RNase III)
VRVRDTTIEVVRGSVVDQDVEVIVNAANTAMRGGGGVDGAIHRAAGPGLLEELERVAPNGAATGSVVLTRGHRLAQPWIIHTPGRVWHGGSHNEAGLLSSCYSAALELARERGLRSIAFCSISTGVYGFPIELAAPIAIGVAIDHANNNDLPDRIVFAMFGAQELRVFSDALALIQRK